MDAINPMTPDERDAVALRFAHIANAAGVVVMEVFSRAFATRHKSDGSPVCEADEAAEAVILEGLARDLPGVPVVAEETAARGDTPTLDGPNARFVLVDPVDGTKQFVAGEGEFTVNIALIEAGAPIAGVVFAPALKRLYVAGAAAWAVDHEAGAALAPDAWTPIATRAYPEAGLDAIVSSKHMCGPTAEFMAGLPIARQVKAGSSLKFCRIAEGAADVYPRFGRTMEWDTAAGHAILTAAGGRVLTPDGAAFTYGDAAHGFENGAFVAWGREGLTPNDSSR